MSPNPEQPTSFEQMEPYIRVNLELFLKEISPELPQATVEKRADRLIDTPMFVELCEGGYEAWDIGVNELYEGEQYKSIYTNLFHGTSYGIKFEAEQMQALLRALRDICVNPILPVEYIKALSGKSSRSMPEIIMRAQIEELAFFLDKQYQKCIYVSGQLKGFVEFPVEDSEKLSAIIDELDSMIGVLGKMKIKDVYQLEEMDLYQLEERAEKIMDSLRELYGDARMYLSSFDPYIPAIPQVSTTGGSVPALALDDMDGYVRFRARRFVQQWKLVS